PQRLDAGKPLFQVFAMSLDGGSEGPKVHAIRSDADRAAAAARAEREDLVEAIEQARPLLLADEPLDLRSIGGKFLGGEPVPKMLEGLLLERRIGVDRLEALDGLLKQVHVNPQIPLGLGWWSSTLFVVAVAFYASLTEASSPTSSRGAIASSSRNSRIPGKTRQLDMDD